MVKCNLKGYQQWMNNFFSKFSESKTFAYSVYPDHTARLIRVCTVCGFKASPVESNNHIFSVQKFRTFKLDRQMSLIRGLDWDFINGHECVLP